MREQQRRGGEVVGNYHADQQEMPDMMLVCKEEREKEKEHKTQLTV